MTSTTLTPGAGNYVVLLSATFDGDAASDDRAYISIYLNGTQVSGTLRRNNVKKNNSAVVSTQAHLIGVLDGQAIDGRWRTNDGDTLTLQQRSLILIKVE